MSDTTLKEIRGRFSLTADEAEQAMVRMGVNLWSARKLTEEWRVKVDPRLSRGTALMVQGAKLRGAIVNLEDPEDLERRKFLAWCKQQGLPKPTPEYRFAAPRKWQFDFAWPGFHVALEKEGFDHRKRERFESDVHKYNEANIRHWLLLRVLPRDLYSVATADLLWRAIRSR